MISSGDDIDLPRFDTSAFSMSRPALRWANVVVGRLYHRSETPARWGRVFAAAG
jgi:hypothetical protein